VYKLLNYHKNIYLLDIKEDTILFHTVIRNEVEGAVQNRFQYIMYKGKILKDIFLGVSLEHSNIDFSNVEDYENFENSITNFEFITSAEISMLLTFSVCDDYPEPF